MVVFQRQLRPKARPQVYILILTYGHTVCVLLESGFVDFVVLTGTFIPIKHFLWFCLSSVTAQDSGLKMYLLFVI